MAVDKSKIKNIVEHDDFHVNELRELVEERGLDVDKRYKDKMIEAVLTDKWTEDEFERLKSRFRRIQRERSPLGYYIGKVSDYPDITDQPNHQELKQKLLTDEVKKEGDRLEQEGFEVQRAAPDEVSGIYWTKTRTFSLNALRELQSRERIYDLGFRFDLDDNLVHINADNYGKRGELLTQFNELGIDIDSVGHDAISGERANEIVRDFVNDFRDELRDAKRQQTFDQENSPPILQIETVEIKLIDGELKTANLEGHQDIFENSVVETLTKDENGRIIHLRGEFTLHETDFKFHVGLPEKLGRVRIKKMGGPTGDLDVLDDAFEFLFDIFHAHFIDRE